MNHVANDCAGRGVAGFAGERCTKLSHRGFAEPGYMDDAAGRLSCKYKTTREANGRPATQVDGTACRDADSQWRIVN